MREFTIKDIVPLLFKLWQNKWIIMFITLSGFFAGMANTVDIETTVRYRATSSVCVTYTTYQEQMRGSSVIKSYSDLVGSLLVCDRAAELLDGTDLTATDIKSMINNWVSSNSYVMYITATADNPQLAIRVTNAVAKAFTEKIASVSGNSSLQILDVAYSADTLTDSSNTTVHLAASASFLLACAWIALKEALGGKVRILSQCSDDPEELLGILPDMKK